jgi:hypothetical protein
MITTFGCLISYPDLPPITRGTVAWSATNRDESGICWDASGRRSERGELANAPVAAEQRSAVPTVVISVQRMLDTGATGAIELGEDDPGLAAPSEAPARLRNGGEPAVPSAGATFTRSAGGHASSFIR